MEEIKKDNRTGRVYTLSTAKNGFKYVKPERAAGALPVLHLSNGNTKTGHDHVLVYSHSIEYTCNHTCGCYVSADGGKGSCYGMTGNYQRYPVNQLYLADTLLFVKENGCTMTRDAIISEIKRTHCKKFRWFGVGDIPTIDFIRMMYEIGRACPDVKFWGYTKKYMLVNHFIEKYLNGNAADFLRYTGLIFSHWRNDDGTYFEMLNPYTLPTSEFIPLGCEDEAKNAAHICPCSNPNVFENCCDCSTPCYELKIGQSMALLEHSTTRTAARDREIRKAHAAIAAAK